MRLTAACTAVRLCASRREAMTFSRLKSMLWGKLEGVDSVAILTSQNPKARQRSPEVNQREYNKLKADLEKLGYGYIPISGEYGVKEDSFVIPNMKRALAVKLGSKYGQQAIIWGYRDEGDAFTFEWIDTDKHVGAVIDKERRHVTLTGEEVAERPEYCRVDTRTLRRLRRAGAK